MSLDGTRVLGGRDRVRYANLASMLSLVLSLAFAQQERLDAPAASISAEDGAAAHWVNPANLGFDPDASAGLWFRQDFPGFSFDQAHSGLAVSTTGGGTGLGLVYRNDAFGNPWWGFSTSLSVRLPENLRLGGTVTWNLPEGADNNFVSWDLGAGWRPLPWLGFGGVARNIGNPAPDLGVWAAYGLSGTVRPLRDKLELSVDYMKLDTSAGNYVGPSNLQTVSGIVRVRPTNGVVLRFKTDTNVSNTDPSQSFTNWTFSGGFELYFDGTGGGVLASSAGAAQGYVVTGPSDAHLGGAGKRVPIVDMDKSYPYQPQQVLFGDTSESYIHLLRRLENAASDAHVKGMVLDISRPRFSWAQLQELRSAIADIQAEGKPVVAYLGGNPSNGAYYLASACDHIWLHPAGGLDLIGLSMEAMFFRGTMDLIGVEPEFVKRSEYKSAPEQQTNTEPSDPAREQMNALLDDLFAALVAGISDGRGMQAEDVIALIDGGPYTANEALELDLVDALHYPDELENALEGVFPKGYDLDRDYRIYEEVSGWENPKQIAVVYVDGPIVSGESSSGGLLGGSNTGSDTVVRYLMAAKEDAQVKAVVLRVDSPGGSAYASDEIWRAVELVEEEGKPVIVSMGGVAASGGYYVAAGATAIYAEPTTITGSIGVYGGGYSFGELYEKLGINYELYLRGRKAGMYSMSRTMDDVELAAMNRMIDDTYLQFKTRVGDGRNMTPEQVEEVARGRVWSGTRAHENGLVDELGGIQDAIARAKAEADLGDQEVDLVTYRGAANSWGDVPKYLASIPDQYIASRIDLPEPVARWLPYAPLAEEKVLVLMPYEIEVR